MPAMRIVTVPCLKDNYAYLVICEATNHAAVVDPSEADPVVAAVEREGVQLKAIWNTHHHWDHTGGNKALVAKHADLEVVAHVSDKGRVDGQTAFVDEGDTVTIGEVSAAIIFNPGHTSGAISFYVAEPGAVFTGDTLFAGGCGRLFEGTPAQMQDSLQRLTELPEDTQIYCGHEYTASNLRFAAAVEPNSTALAQRRAQVDELRAQNKPTVPFSVAEERATNPFVRVRDADVIASARANGATSDEPAEILRAVREWKNRG